jgi:hypothetical protein
MKIKTIAHIHYSKWHFDEKGEFQIFPFKLEDDKHRCYVGQQEIEINVPDDFDPRGQQIAALEKEKQKVMADYQKTVTDINNRINNLKAITV